MKLENLQVQHLESPFSFFIQIVLAEARAPDWDIHYPDSQSPIVLSTNFKTPGSDIQVITSCNIRPDSAVIGWTKSSRINIEGGEGMGSSQHPRRLDKTWKLLALNNDV